MKISGLQENLKQGLFIVSHVAGKNINLPILNNVMLEVKNGDIKLIATDLEMGVVSKIRGKIEAEGAFTVDSKIITDYIGLLPNKKVAIRHEDKNLLVECENYRTKIKGQSAEEFPLIPSVDKKTYYSIEAQELKQALAQVLFAVSTSDSRIELTGVLFKFSNNSVTLATTDSYRLAEKSINVKANTDSKEKQNVIVPAKTLSELLRILTGIKDNEDSSANEIKCYIADNQILFIAGATELISRLIEGQYPDYQQIIPATSKTKAVVNRSEFVRAVKAASLFSKAGINDINLDFPAGKNKLIITSTSGQTGENITELAANVSGNDNGVVVNYRYLLDGLNNIGTEDVKIKVVDSNTPCALEPEGKSAYTYIIMPIKQ